MPRPRTLPESDHELTKLINEHGMAEVGRMFEVSTQAVSDAVKRRKLNGVEDKRRQTVYKFWPWAIRTEHQALYETKRLRLYAKELAGVELTPHQQGMLALWKKRMAEEDWVLLYDPEADPEKPWRYLPRRDGIDVNFIRNIDVP